MGVIRHDVKSWLVRLDVSMCLWGDCIEEGGHGETVGVRRL